MTAPHRALLSILLLLALGSSARDARAADPIAEQAERLERHAREAFEQREREAAIRALSKIGGAKAAAVLLPLFDDPFVHLRDHATSGWIAMLRGPKGPETRAWLQSKALRNKSEAVRAAVWTALAVAPAADTVRFFAAGVAREKDPLVLAAWARAARRLDPAEALAPVALDRLGALRSDPAQWDLAVAAGHHGGEQARSGLSGLWTHNSAFARAGAAYAEGARGDCPPDRLEQGTNDREAVVRIALAQGLGAWSENGRLPPSAHVAWDTLLGDDDWRVRAAAIQAGLQRWTTEIVPPLIDRLVVERGRLRDDVQRALETFTGADVAADADLWRAWWQARKESFEPIARPRLTGGRVPFRDAAQRPGEDEGTVAFFDLPLHSKRLLFVFDLSGSIRNPAWEGADAPTKLEVIREEMARTLRALPEDTAFDLLVYRYPSSFPPKPKQVRAFGKLAPARSANVKKALAWLDKQEAKGWGAFVEPLETAIRDEAVDTAVLLSDGRPSRGRYDRDFRILQEFPALNRVGQLAVHTVLLGTKGADRKFMQALADLTGGRFRSAGGR
jgi:hypothetical protein